MERWRRDQLAGVGHHLGASALTRMSPRVALLRSLACAVSPLFSGLVAAQRIRLVFVSGIAVLGVLSLIVARGMTSPVASAASGPHAGD